MRLPVIEVRSLFKKFMVGKVPIQPLNGVSFSLYPGEFLVIHGPSGCGKTTLLNMIAGLDNYDAGEVYIRGRGLSKLNKDELVKHRRSAVGMIFQNFNLIPSLSALDNVALPLTFSGVSWRERRERSIEVLTLVGLKDRIYHYPSELSGGEQQRVAIARALVTNPWIILADEPTGNLDTKTGREIIALLEELNRKYKRTILLVTHNLQFAASSNRILYMKDGQMVKEEVIPETMRFKSLIKTPEVSYFIAPHLRNFMKMRDILGLAFKHFRFAKTRTFLTCLGMIIGISSIVLFVSLGFGLQQITTSSLASFEDLQTVTVNRRENSNERLSDGTVNQIKKIDHVTLVSPVLTATASGNLEGTNTAIILKGVLPENLSFEQVAVTTGQSFSSSGALEAIVSETALKNFDISDQNSVLGKVLKLEFLDLEKESFSLDLSQGLPTKTLELKIVGTTGERVTPDVFTAVQAMEKIISSGYTELNVKVDDMENVEAVKNEIEELGFQTSAVMGLIKKINQAFLIIQMILGLIGGIALIVASFGIINTMIISLLERTHEIGIMKALGIARRDIKRLFTYEATLFGFFGGLSGVALGWLVGGGINLLVAYLMKKSGETQILVPFVTPWKFAILVFIFALLIARFAGIYPAWKASRGSPLEALRYE